MIKKGSKRPLESGASKARIVDHSVKNPFVLPKKRRNNKKASEFGKGFVYNLVLFAKHYDKAGNEMEVYINMRRKNSNSNLFSEERALSLWINSASDHLFELVIPKKFKHIKEIKQLQKMALDYGHGVKMSVGMPKEVYNKIGALLSIISRKIDEELGVKTIKATWE